MYFGFIYIYIYNFDYFQMLNIVYMFILEVFTFSLIKVHSLILSRAVDWALRLSTSHDLVSQRVKGLLGCRRWVIKLCLLLWGWPSCVRTPSQSYTASHDHPWPYSEHFKGTRNEMLQRSLFRFLNDSFLHHFWVAPDRTQRTYITALWRHRRAVAMATGDLVCCYAALIVYFQVLRSICFHTGYMRFFWSPMPYVSIL